MKTQKLLGCGLMSALFTLSPTAQAIEGELKKPQTMEDMWQIIQAQQQQLNEMQKKLEQANAASAGNQVQTLERKTNVLTEEVEKLRTELVIPEETEYKSQYGLGPAASKVYQVGKGLSIGGYGEANYQNIIKDEKADEKKDDNRDNTDFERLVLYVGYKFTDNILFNSEIEFEHSSTGKDGEVSVEFAALDFFLDPMANIRAGMVLMPMGFLNQIHEPPFYFGNNRPEVERRIIPSTWREIGVGLFGELMPGLTYTAYAVNGLNAADFDASGIRSGRQSGSKAKAEDLAFVGRLDYTPDFVPGLTVGGSAYLGNSGQDQTFAGRKADVFTQLYEAHVQWKYRGLEFRTLGSWGHIDDAAVLSANKMNQTIGEENYGWYTEVGYDIMPHIMPDSTQYLAPFFRYEQLDTIASAPTGFADDLTKDQRIYQVGVNYKPIPNVVIKADYRDFDSEGGDLPDDFNLGLGFIF
ncbi:MAG: porin [Gammaproteobacteria bacterium]